MVFSTQSKIEKAQKIKGILNTFGVYDYTEQFAGSSRATKDPAGRGDVPAAPVMRRHQPFPDAAAGLDAEDQRMQQCAAITGRCWLRPTRRARLAPPGA